MICLGIESTAHTFGVGIVKDKKILKTCEIIENMFKELLPIDKIREWDGNHDLFENFINRLRVYFKMSFF